MPLHDRRQHVRPAQGRLHSDPAGNLSLHPLSVRRLQAGRSLFPQRGHQRGRSFRTAAGRGLFLPDADLPDTRRLSRADVRADLPHDGGNAHRRRAERPHPVFPAAGAVFDVRPRLSVLTGYPRRYPHHRPPCAAGCPFHRQELHAPRHDGGYRRRRGSTGAAYSLPF